MKYDNITRRSILYQFISGDKKGKSNDEIISEIMDLEGTQEDKRQLFEDCKAYIKFKKKFNERKNISSVIEEANQYISDNPESILIKEELLAFYIKAASLKSEKHMERIKQAIVLARELNRAEPNDLRTISKIFTIFLITKDYKKVDKLIDNINMIPNGKTDGVLFGQSIEYYREISELSSNEIEKEFGFKKNNSPVNIADFVIKRVENINFGKEREKIAEGIGNLMYARGLLRGLLQTCSKTELKKYKKAIELLSKKITEERMKMSYIQESEDIQTTKILIRDRLICEDLDKTIYRKRNERTKEELLEQTEKIRERVLKLMQQCQIRQAYNENRETIKADVEIIKRENKGMLTERENKQIRRLTEYLRSKTSNLYDHDSWVSMKYKYIIETNKESNER